MAQPSMDPRLWELLREGEPQDEVMALARLREGVALPAALRVVSRFGEIATCRLRREDILDVRAHPAVASLKAPHPLVPDLAVAETEDGFAVLPSDERRPAGLPETGRGVVVGVVDWGCDFAHPGLRKEDGATRLLALWDQQGAYDPSHPNRFGYGRVYTADEIDRALLSSDPYAALGYAPWRAGASRSGTHGTHVLDIAVGNGAGGGPPGLAPEAEIVFVDVSTRKGGFPSLGDSVGLLEALFFIDEQAGLRPWAANLSMGNITGPHDGSTLVEQAIDALLVAAPGRALCQSCGNYYERGTHTVRWMRPGETATITWVTSAADRTPNDVEVWYSRRDRLRARVTAPAGEASEWCDLGEQVELRAGDAAVARVYNRAQDPNNGDHHLAVFQYPTGQDGAWRLEVFGEDVADGRLHAWIERDEECAPCQSRFAADDAVTEGTLNAICNGYRTVTVGAYDRHAGTFEMARFSSVGPTRDGRRKPDLVAPGVAVLAARSASAADDAPALVRKSGTSMAAPHATGTVALMMEAAGRPLTNAEVRRLLLSATEAEGVPDEQRSRAGHGVLDVARAVESARRLGRSEETDTFTEDAAMDATNEEPTGERCCATCGEAMDDVGDANVNWIVEPDSVGEPPEMAELAARLVTSGHAEDAFLEDLLLAGVGAAAVSPYELFHAVQGAGSETLRRYYAELFETVGLPARSPSAALQRGDIVVEIVPGSATTLVSVIERADAPYAAVVGPTGAGPFRWRQLTRGDGRLGPEQVIVRLRNSSSGLLDGLDEGRGEGGRDATQWLADAHAGFLGKIPKRASKRKGSRVLASVMRPEDVGHANWDPQQGGRLARDEAIVKEILQGNVPLYLRHGKMVTVSFKDKSGKSHGIVYQVLPDYLAVGGINDHVVVPLTPAGAQRVADAFGCILPTPIMVDQIFSAAAVKVDAHSRPYYRSGYDPTRDERLATHDYDSFLQRGDRQTSTAAFLEHDLKIREELRKANVERAVGMPLVAGYKKDLVISAHPNPRKLQFYGWYPVNKGKPAGKPIQSQSGPGFADNAHDPSYVDYSHGVRLVAGTMLVDGKEMRAADVLAHPVYSLGLSREGPIASPRVPNVAGSMRESVVLEREEDARMAEGGAAPSVVSIDPAAGLGSTRTTAPIAKTSPQRQMNEALDRELVLFAKARIVAEWLDRRFSTTLEKAWADTALRARLDLSKDKGLLDRLRPFPKNQIPVQPKDRRPLFPTDEMLQGLRRPPASAVDLREIFGLLRYYGVVLGRLDDKNPSITANVSRVEARLERARFDAQTAAIEKFAVNFKRDVANKPILHHVVASEEMPDEWSTKDVPTTHRTVARSVVAVLRRLRDRNQAWKASTYPRHFWNDFSVDMYIIAGRTADGFYARETVRQFFSALNAACEQDAPPGKFAWKAVYNDKVIAAETDGLYGAGRVLQAKGHGPGGDIHIHLDLRPLVVALDSTTGFRLDGRRVVLS